MHQIRMCLLVALLAFALAPVRCWTIETSAGEFIPGDTDPHWLVCRQTSTLGKEHRIDTIETIRLNKYDSRDRMTPIAEINEDNRIHIFLPGANFTVTGDVLNNTSKFLRLTWSEVDVDDAGRYGCEVGGFDVLGNGVIFKLKPKEIKVKELTVAFLKQLVQSIKEEYDVTHKRLQSEMKETYSRLQSEMKETYSRLQSEIENNTRIQKETKETHSRINLEMEKKFNSELANLTSLMKRCQCQPPTEPPTSPATTLPTTTPPVVTTTLPTTTPSALTTKLTVKTTPQTEDDQWPLGRYLMVGPAYPCVASHSSVLRSNGCYDYSQYRQVIASTDETYCFCYLDVKNSSRATWPRGNYCLETYSGYCLTSFTKQRVDDPVRSYYHYCCRSDGSPSNEIHLPTKSPFYLYTDESHVCQQVKGMTVTQTQMVYEAKGTYRFKGGKKSVVVNSRRLCHYQPV